MLIPLRIVRRGYRVLFDPTARAIDGPSATARQEFVRKARTIAGTFQLFARERWLLNPFRNRMWFETLSHKGLRLAAPLLQAGGARVQHRPARSHALPADAHRPVRVLWRRARRLGAGASQAAVRAS